MKPHDESIARDRLYPAFPPSAGNQLTAACAALAIAVLLWIFGCGLSPRTPHPGVRSRAPIAKLWDKHQDVTQASTAALMPAASRRPPSSPTRIAVPSTAIPLPSVGYRPAEEHRPVTLAPHLSQIHLRAPPFLA